MLEEKTEDVTEESSASEKTVADLIDEEVAEDENLERPKEEETSPESDSEGEQERTVPVRAVQKERRKRQEAERRERELKEKLAEVESRKTNTEESSGLSKPKVSDFDNYEDYLDAIGDYTEKKAEIIADEKVRKRLAEQSEADRESQQKEAYEKQQKVFYDRLDEAGEKFEDFEESFEYVQGFAMQSRAYSQALVESENVGELINYLAKNPEEAERITGLSEVNKIKAIGALETKLKSPPKPNKQTKAPKPINPVGGGDGTSSDTKVADGMSRAERKSKFDQAIKSGKTVAEVYGIDVE